MKAFGKWTELRCRCLDSSLRLEIEGIGAGAGDETDANHRPVTTNHESNLCTPAATGI